MMLDVGQNYPRELKIPTPTYRLVVEQNKRIGALPLSKNSSIKYIPTTRLAKMNIGVKIVELTANVHKVFL